jgi:hypothetical protein
VTFLVECGTTTDSHCFLCHLSLETRVGIFFQQDGASPHFGLQVAAYLNQRYESRWIGRRGPVPCPPRSPDLTPIDFFLWDPVEGVTYRTNVHTTDKLGYRIMDAAAYIRDHPEMIERAVNCCLERPRLCIENRSGYFEEL